MKVMISTVVGPETAVGGAVCQREETVEVGEEEVTEEEEDLLVFRTQQLSAIGRSLRRKF